MKVSGKLKSTENNAVIFGENGTLLWDAKTYEIICADLSLNNVTDAEVFPGLIRQMYRKIRLEVVDGAYDMR